MTPARMDSLVTNQRCIVYSTTAGKVHHDLLMTSSKQKAAMGIHVGSGTKRYLHGIFLRGQI